MAYVSRRPSRLGIVAALCVALLAVSWVGAAPKPRMIVIVPYNSETVERDRQWVGEAVAQLLSLGLAQHGALVPVDRARLRAFAKSEAWTEVQVLQAAKGVRADAALFGQVVRKGTDLVIQPRLLEVKAGASDPVALEPVTVPEAELSTRLATLPVDVCADAEGGLDRRGGRADRAGGASDAVGAGLRVLRARRDGRRARRPGRQRGGGRAAHQGHRGRSDLRRGRVHAGQHPSSPDNRWKATAQYRAAAQLDPTYPEPMKALGDLFLAAPRRLFDQAVEAYDKAIQLRPFYADAHVGLGDARAAKGDVDGAIGAYQKALLYNPANPRVYMSLGKIYYGEKGLYYEAVTAYKKAIDLDPQSVEARLGLGEVYEDKGLYKEAIEEYKKVIELDAKHTGALYNLALVYEKVDPKESIVQWERYIALASQLPSEKDWVDVARQHLRKLKGQVKD